MLKLLRIKSRRTLLTAQWDSIDSIHDGTCENKINQMKYCDHTVNIHVLSFHETLITTIDHHFFMRKKYHGQGKDGLKCHINLLGKDKKNYRLISVNKRSFSFRYRRLPQSHLHQRRITHRWHQWLLM